MRREASIRGLRPRAGWEAGAPSTIELPAQILDSNTIEAKLALAEIYDQVPVAVR
ncbi:MAG: hypothetical protein GY856_13725 [bacterium]|nr:hypothetical protein [bacterium]